MIPSNSEPGSGLARLYAAYLQILKWIIMAMAGLSGLAILVVIVVTCIDVVFRKAGHPVPGALDLVTITGTISVACALPYTTAIKGHVAIEFLYHKLGHVGRVVLDTFIRVLMIAFFTALGWQTLQHGLKLKASGQVTPTINVPEFWVPYTISAACLLMVLVEFHHMVHPGKEMIKP